MKRVRVIPTLLIEQGRLVKTIKFGKRTYVGDPVNTVKIFSDKEVDELMLLDIGVAKSGKAPDFGMLREIASECFIPFGYGGGIRTLDHARQAFDAGVEKVVLNTALFETPDLPAQIGRIYGAQAVVASLDVKKGMFGGPRVVTQCGTKKVPGSVLDVARRVVAAGVGEILLTAVDRDGTFDGYDLDLIRQIAETVEVPVIASGGARDIPDFLNAIRDSGASAVAAGAQFVFKGPHRAVLVNYPSQTVLREGLFNHLGPTDGAP
ncbi:MAG: AglZ/HisF2 family acetamidino modification protein [Minwuia sp.]|nr:AglZ/HisF2 family acetamidino modification protein [Minwuia sp.]